MIIFTATATVTMRQRMTRARLLMFKYLWVAVALIVAYVAMAAVDARTIDYEALEKAWEQGDSKHELQSEYEQQLDEYGSAGEGAKTMGPQMVFVTLTPDALKAEPLPELASRWKDMLFNGGVEVSIYEIEDKKLLVGLQRGLQMPTVRRFLHEQPEVIGYEWDGQSYAGLGAGGSPQLPDSIKQRSDDSTDKRHPRRNKRTKKKKKQSTADARDEL
ncbi:TPA: hypothetical protein N0F65_008686 [Lagenidium giganteum]|uniref:Mesoderm development candidate 2 n=1 Tax=Lagenidium giganteum TaxID=4803 RepID=A0AAV2ZAN8_9STRA|nr:TPA: hypothetical protein N0F65_008686 [Lagenidium giganteum]